MKSGQIVLRSGCLSLLALCVGAYALSQRKPAEQETNKLKLQPLLGQPLPMWEKALGKPSKIVPPKTSSQAIEERIYKIRGNSTTS
ncbi:MAG: hypothetical protein MUC92_03860, partial [Fimbriimonadaceae bacterium]|nr:hypothetical protein [Fimbriimonadaceae bacterium]